MMKWFFFKSRSTIDYDLTQAVIDRLINYKNN